MGFYNFNDHVWVCGFETRDHHTPGNVALISQSGSGMCGIVDVEGRIDFNLAVSTGQELTVTLADYLDFALEMEGTRVVGLFIETIRDVPAMTAALDKAKAKQIPIVAIKVGRTDLSVELAKSHSGALAGNYQAYQAYFDRHGILPAEDVDELTTTLILFAQPHPVREGGLVSLHDSGGLRQLAIDLADQVDTPYTELTNETVDTLQKTLEPGLPAVNPLDSWNAGGPDFEDRAAGYLTALMADPGAAFGAVIQDRNKDSSIYPEYVNYIRKAHAATGKPGALVSARQGTGMDPLVIEATREGFPVLDGMLPFFKGVKHLFDYRDFKKRSDLQLIPAPEEAVQKWRERLSSGDLVSEADGARLLRDFGLPALTYHKAASAKEAIAAAIATSFPVVMKTAMPHIAHKTDQGGVALGLQDEEAVRNAYTVMADRLGPQVAITQMIDSPGVEMILGATQDPTFGPLVTIGFGGIYAETLKDVTYLLPPFDAQTVRRKLDGLKLRPLLEAQRGRPALDVDALAKTAAGFSSLVAALRDSLVEIEINPLLVMPEGCQALDILIQT